MKISYGLFPSLIILLLSCTPKEKAPSELELQYNKIQASLNANQSDLNRMFAQLPLSYQKELKTSMQLIQDHSFVEMLKKENNKDGNLRLLLGSMEKFMGKLSAAKDFRPNRSQAKQYMELREKLMKDKAIVDQYLSTPANPNDIQEVSIHLILQNIKNYDLPGFLSVTMLTSDEFDKAIGDLNREWETVLVNLTMFDLNKKMEEIIRQ